MRGKIYAFMIYRTLYPLPRRLESVHDLGLLAALLRVEVVLPPSRLREGHEDRLNAAAGLEAEHRPSVVHQVELDVPEKVDTHDTSMYTYIIHTLIYKSQRKNKKR